METLHEQFMQIGRIETERLLLRRITTEDSAAVYDYSHDPRTSRYLLWSPHPDEDHTRRHLEQVQKLYRKGEFHDFAVVWKNTGQMIGTVGFTKLDERSRVGEIGYVLHPSYWGMGIATEAAQTLIAFGFGGLKLHRIEGRYMVENEASRRVMEKCGMTLEGILRDSLFVKGQYRSIGICSILKEEYDAAYHSCPIRAIQTDRPHWHDRLR